MKIMILIAVGLMTSTTVFAGNDLGKPPLPTYSVSMRHGFPNLAAGSAFEDDLYVHNRSFSIRKLQLELVYSWMDLLDRREITLMPGGRYDGKLRFDVPKVEGVRPLPISVEANLLLDGSNVFSRVFDFTVLPNDTVVTKTVSSLPGEAWWGLATRYGRIQPWTEKSESFAVDLARENFGNQAAPILVSSKGRWVWCERPFAAGFTNGVWTLTSESGAKIVQGTAKEGTLKGALLDCARRHFPASGKTPDLDLIAKPQLNTWIELTYNQNQKDILKYAHDAIANGFPPAVMMVDDAWQYDYGTWQFDPRRFENPKAMCDDLHAMGFKIMLWVVPYVSMDSREYRQLAKSGGLCLGRLRDDNGQMIESATKKSLPEAFSWWNGQSACLDLTHPEGFKWFVDELAKLRKDYGVDGFKFDAGDNRAYPSSLRYHDPKARAVDQSEAYARLGLEFPLNEYRACWKMAGQPLVQRLCDKGHKWKHIAQLVPDMIAVGLLGHSFVCPDMVGGGEWKTFLPGNPFDPELFVRSAQVHALSPMIQFSAAPWRVLDAEHLVHVRKAVETRQKFAPRFVELAKECAKTGEPMLRSMEYAFPGHGYESIRDQFMMGDFLLVAPQVVKGATMREVVIPPGRWKGDDGLIVEGPSRITVDTPLSRLPYFTKEIK